MSPMALYFFLGVQLCSLNRVTVAATSLSSFHFPTRQEVEKKCGYYEDALLNFTELVTKYGYYTEHHAVTTDDGYILTIFRFNSKACTDKIRSPPVILQHGLADSSVTFIAAGPGVELGYLLADACFDLWMPNNRGNFYSRKHVNMNPDKDKKFWNYSFDEIGYYDVAASIDFVLFKTGVSQVDFIGHSQGTTAFLALISRRPQYNYKIRLAQLLAPVAWMAHVESSTLRIIAKAMPELNLMARAMGVREVLTNFNALAATVEFICQYLPKLLCGTNMAILTGLKLKNIASKTLAVVAGHYPAGTSMKSLLHFSQIIKVDKFQRYDYGILRNLVIYKAFSPPQYDLSNITVPVVLYCGKRDWMSSLIDVQNLRKRLLNLVEYHHVMVPDDWSHVEFVMGDRVPTYLAGPVIGYIDKYRE